jgi:hypothetical protein
MFSSPVWQQAQNRAERAVDRHRLADLEAGRPGPSASTHPAFSWPRVKGSSALKTPVSNSWMTCTSEWQMPAAPTLTNT